VFDGKLHTGYVALIRQFFSQDWYAACHRLYEGVKQDLIRETHIGAATTEYLHLKSNGEIRSQISYDQEKIASSPIQLTDETLKSADHTGISEGKQLGRN
jgi:hypothetical protein